MTPGSPLDPYLDPGERLLWSSQPRQGVRLQASDAFLIPFSLMWGGFAFFWEATALGLAPLGASHLAINRPPLLFALWGIPFCLVGLYLIFGRFFFDAASRKRTWYGLTDQRVIVLKSFFKTSITSFDLATLNNLSLNERKDNSGDILFGSPGPYGAFANGGGPNGRGNAVPGFYLLPSARQVYNQIRDAQQKLRK